MSQSRRRFLQMGGGGRFASRVSPPSYPFLPVPTRFWPKCRVISSIWEPGTVLGHHVYSIPMTLTESSIILECCAHAQDTKAARAAGLPHAGQVLQQAGLDRVGDSRACVAPPTRPCSEVVSRQRFTSATRAGRRWAPARATRP